MLSSPHACCPSLVLAVGEGRNLSADKKEVMDYGINPSLKDGERIFTNVCCDRTRGNCFKLKEGKFRLDKRKKIFTVTVVRHRNSG